MRGSNNERRQTFSGVAAAEAWHGPFGVATKVADLHVDVVFGTAPLGEEASSPIRFRLGVRRAEVVVVLPEFEPVAVDPVSVSRDAPQISGRTIRRRTQAMGGSLGAKIAGAFRGKRPTLELEIDAALHRKTEHSLEWEASSPIDLISVTQSRSDDGHYRWVLLPQLSESLEGRPWDAVAKPRMKLVDQRKSPDAGIAPGVRVEIRCRREDLVISDLVLKDEAIWAALSSRVGFKNRLAAAEAYIRDRLASDGLEVGDMEELFSRLTLASVSAHSQQSP